jgi:hypothetical protein
MFLSLIIVPVVYGLFDAALERLGLNKKEVIDIEK